MTCGTSNCIIRQSDHYPPYQLYHLYHNQHHTYNHHHHHHHHHHHITISLSSNIATTPPTAQHIPASDHGHHNHNHQRQHNHHKPPVPAAASLYNQQQYFRRLDTGCIVQHHRPKPTSNSNFRAFIKDRRPGVACRQSQQSSLAKVAMTNQRDVANTNVSDPRSVPTPATGTNGGPSPKIAAPNDPYRHSLDKPRSRSSLNEAFPTLDDGYLHPVSIGPPAHPSSLASALRAINDGTIVSRDPAAAFNTDSPYDKSHSSTASGSPRLPPMRANSGSQTPRVRPHATTLSIPGMTRSLISPDGKIADRDVGSKLVIIMVGLPARGKSYITKKIRRYLAWQQHNTGIFNVGKRRRTTAHPAEKAPQPENGLSNGTPAPSANPASLQRVDSAAIDHSAKFFDPNNAEASKLREEIALETLHELLDYLITGGGAVGILDATNSTIHRRQLLFDAIKAREPKLGILFIESECQDPNLLEANMRLKLSGPDYKDKDPVKSLADFKERVKAYESAYVPLGDYEEERGMQYIKMIDVGKKITSFGLEGFLSSGIAHYLSSFNLSPRQIWITRHGQSFDNQAGKIGGDSELTDRGHFYSENLYRFITHKRKEWLVEQKSKMASSTFPPLPGDRSPPYPELNRELDEKNTCVWTSMLSRSIQTAQWFEADEDYDVKNWEMLNELNAGKFEGMTYEEISRTQRDEYVKRQQDKLHYVYPGVGGEGYLQVISRLREIIREMERIKDHVVVIGHRSVCRVLLAYFMDLTRDHIADLDMPLGMIYCIEPKPYGIEFHAYKYNEGAAWFDEIEDHKPKKTVDRSA